ncbi:Metallo-dependent phosphatase-like protein, partial [Radiomyces spectabilis]|uniref:Metallo-dependent phosphatase-like protein n=1 Tax=Radiomyces spectabilis TaxID=64574 RepID=UPI00221EA91A
MGDLMDGGREWKDEGWQKEVDRFFRLFNSQAPTYYMVGNHDIGFGNGIRPDVKRRFISAFGPTSYFVNMTNYVLVVIDTVSLSSSDPNVYQDALDVMTSSLPPLPRILMTHVPLYRPEGTYCGPDRWQSRPGGIRDGQGYQYQNLLSPELSKQLLDHINPKAIFSGDDHDYCAVTHRPGVTEYTVPTFSMAQGLRYPGVMLLDLSSSEP